MKCGVDSHNAASVHFSSAKLSQELSLILTNLVLDWPVRVRIMRWYSCVLITLVRGRESQCHFPLIATWTWTDFTRTSVPNDLMTAGSIFRESFELIASVHRFDHLLLYQGFFNFALTQPLLMSSVAQTFRG